MENASKALIIAGAILLSILLISLGIMVYNQAIGVTDSDTLDQLSLTTHNNQFTQYEGDSVSATEVKALITAINQNNLNYEEVDSQYIKIKSSDVTTSTISVDTSKKYSVEFSTINEDGYVDEVSIDEL